MYEQTRHHSAPLKLTTALNALSVRQAHGERAAPVALIGSLTPLPSYSLHLCPLGDLRKFAAQKLQTANLAALFA